VMYMVVRSLTNRTRIRWVAVAMFTTWADADEYRLTRQKSERIPHAIVIIPR
jgi:hypothetical protein